MHGSDTVLIWGRKPSLLVGLALEAARALLYTFVTNPYLMMAVQVLDGITGAIVTVLVILVIADLTSGRPSAPTTKALAALARPLVRLTGFDGTVAGCGVGGSHTAETELPGWACRTRTRKCQFRKCLLKGEANSLVLRKILRPETFSG
jgi:MFS family permease